MSDGFQITFEGGDADGHRIDMRFFGESLQGFDRIISDMLVALTQKRLPKRGERAFLVLKAGEPVAGSVTVAALLQESAAVLQLGIQVFGPNGAEMLSNWVQAVFSYYSGRQTEAQKAVEKMADLMLAQIAASDRTDERRHEEAMGLQQLLGAVLEKLGPAAAQAVAPVGRTAKRVKFETDKQKAITVDNDDADKIRSGVAQEFGPLQEFVLRTDGFTFHTRKLSVEHPERSGYLLAEVDDPVAEEENNPYANAVNRKATIRVQGKAGYKNGQIVRLVIMDFGGEIEDAA
ncbi:DUF7946 domain-containing protein [Sphingomonas sp. UNC305MFCol5.2]|uniref:DUF7946 domain-containing protein n=1 Tax=Sphingomonas sp. UNC305MFCol5.2 TaxID=1449076 RepID=UPI0004A6E64B|nr:hypothetical protein [Sphingomonas sp. UNC305MFCol5.2]